MNPTVVVANQDLHEANLITSVMSASYDTKAVADIKGLLSSLDNAAAVVLDANFSDALGIDALMEILGHTSVPVVMITPDDQPACAIEAMRCGAAGYLVKTASYADLLTTAVQDAIVRSRSQSELKREMTDLRKRNAALEKELKELRIKASLGITGVLAQGSLGDADLLSYMEETIAERIKCGTLQIPSYPRIAMKLRQLLQQEVGIAEVAQLLAQDAAVSAKLLRVANSAQFTNLRPVETIDGAVSRLGLATSCNLAEMVANRSLYVSRNAAYRAILDEQWIHSIAVAHGSVAIARQVGKADFQNMFSLGLLHDAGRLGLMQAIAQVDLEGKCIDGEENRKQFFTFLRKHNVTSGVVLVKRWGFGQDFLDAVRFNHDLPGADKPTRALLIVNLANTLARAIGYGLALDSPDELERSPAKAFLFPGDSDLSHIIEEVHRAIEQTRTMLA